MIRISFLALLLTSLTQSIAHTTYHELKGHSSPISCIGVSQDGSLIASGDEKGNIIVWSPFEKTINTPIILTGHSKTITTLTFHPENNRILISTAKDGLLYSWNIDAKQASKVNYFNNQGFISALTFTPNNRSCIMACDDSASQNPQYPLIHLLAEDLGKTEIPHKSISSGHTKSIISIQCSSKHNSFVTGSLDGTIKMWKSKNTFCCNISSHNLNTPVTALHWPTQHDFFFVGLQDGRILEYNINYPHIPGKLLQGILNKPITSLNISPCGKKLQQTQTRLYKEPVAFEACYLPGQENTRIFINKTNLIIKKLEEVK